MNFPRSFISTIQLARLSSDLYPPLVPPLLLGLSPIYERPLGISVAPSPPRLSQLKRIRRADRFWKRVTRSWLAVFDPRSILSPFPFAPETPLLLLLLLFLGSR